MLILTNHLPLITMMLHESDQHQMPINHVDTDQSPVITTMLHASDQHQMPINHVKAHQSPVITTMLHEEEHNEMLIMLNLATDAHYVETDQSPHMSHYYNIT